MATLAGKYVLKLILNFFIALNVPILDRAEDHVYFMHAFGFYKTILNKINRDQLELLFGDGLMSLMQVLRSDRGKISFSFLNDNQEHRNLIHNRITALAFIPNNKDVQLPLITLPENLLITVYFYTNDNMDWDRLLVKLSNPNRLDGSLWIYVNTVEDESQGFKVIFRVDGKTHSIILDMERQLNLNGGIVNIIDENNGNPYQNDMNNLPV